MKFNNILCKVLASLVLVLYFTACGNNNRPIITPIENEFTQAIAIDYGPYYNKEGIVQNVISLDLYTKNLSLDSTDHVTGSGVNLYFSDIFLTTSDTSLLTGKYVSDTSALPLTFLPGMQFEGEVSGAYLLFITENGYSVDLIKEGTFLVQQDADTMQIDFSLVRSSGQKYDATFRGIVEYRKDQ